MQQRYDEAEAALKRALEIDPNYRHARDNLALLPQTRLLGHPPIMQITHPFEGRQIEKSIVFRKAWIFLRRPRLGQSHYLSDTDC